MHVRRCLYCGGKSRLPHEKCAKDAAKERRKQWQREYQARMERRASRIYLPSDDLI